MAEEVLAWSYLTDALRWAGHRVFHATALADGPPQLGVGGVLLQWVCAFVPEVVVDGGVSDRAVVHVHLTSQVLECPGGAATKHVSSSSISRFSSAVFDSFIFLN